MTNRPCPLCQSASDTIFLAARTGVRSKAAFAARKKPEPLRPRYLLCAKCDLVYASPTLPADEALAEYREAPYIAPEAGKFAAEDYDRAVAGRVSLKNLHVVDIGAGNGAFLERVRFRGATISGYEISREAIAHSPVGEFLKAEPFQNETADVITLFQTWEHLPNPGKTLKDIGSCLRKGGWLITVSHDHRSLPNRLLGEYSPLYDIQHYQVFSRHTWRPWLEKAGFESVSVSSFTNTYPLAYWLSLLPTPWLPRRIPRFALPLRAGNTLVVARWPGH